MKLIYLFVLIFNFYSLAEAQSIGIGTQTPNNSAILDLTSTSQGLLIPRMTQAQRIIIQPAQGLMVYQTDSDSGFYFYRGTEWKTLTNNTSNSATLIVFTKRYPSIDI